MDDWEPNRFAAGWPGERICSYASSFGFSRRRDACARRTFDSGWSGGADRALCRCNARSKAGTGCNRPHQNDRCSRRWPGGLWVAVHYILSRPL